MPQFAADPIPLLRSDCAPPLVLGPARLTTAAMHGADEADLAALVEAACPEEAARLFDTALAHQLAYRRAEGLDIQDEALAASSLFRVASETTTSSATRVLAIMVPGDLMANTPLDFVTNHLDVRLDLLYLRPGEKLPGAIPDHDVAFFAAGECDPETLARLRHLYRHWPRPAVNDPGLLPLLARDCLPGVLAGIAGLRSPSAVEVGRAELDRLVRTGGDVSGLLPGGVYPVLLRPAGSHAGAGLRKLDGPRDLASYLTFSFARSYYLSSFVDYRSPDGLFRKYRIAFIDRTPHLCHMAASENWMVHYLNAGMADSAAKRTLESEAMSGFATGFAIRHRDALHRFCERLPFDCFSVDCGETRDGQLLVFEADVAAIIHLMDPVETYPYKHVQMRRVFGAFDLMLRRRAAATATRCRAGARDLESA